MKIKLAALLLTVGLAGGAYADSLVDGDADAGRSKSVPCGACHGADGNSQNPLWPSLAGQNAPYILAQLKAFKDGSRSDPLMAAQAMMLDENAMADLAVYFESLPAAAQAVADVSSISRAESLYRGGDLEDKTSACIACHGPTGAGNPAANYPVISGQHAAYTAKQLKDYRSGTRTTDGKTRIMRDIARTLDDEDIAALSSYLQGLH